MNKACPTCSQPLTEYVGFASRAGDENNPWDCLNKSCVPQTEKEETTQPGLHGLVEFPDNWDVTWVELKAEIEDHCENYYQGCCTGLHVKLRYGCAEVRDDIGLLRTWPIPTRSVSNQSAVTTSASLPSSLQQHTQQSAQVNPSSKANGSQQLSPDLNSCAYRWYNTQPRENDQPDSLEQTKQRLLGLKAEIERQLDYLANPRLFVPIT